MAEIKEIKNKETWERFNLKSSQPSFLQSWVWGEFQKNLGKAVFELGIFEKNKLIGISLVYEEKAKLGSFYYCPAGPVFKNITEESFKAWLEHVTELVKRQNGSFLRIDPRQIGETEKNLFTQSGFVQAPEYTQPECSALINLTKSEKELLSAMSSSTRYNVNASGRKGVVVREGESKDVAVLLGLLKETAGRKNLTLPAEQNYHKKQFEVLSKEGLMKLYIAESLGKPLSAALVVNYTDTSYYLHAANSLEKKHLRSSYPLVWYAIKEAKKSGLKILDFWGIAPNDDPQHPWAGVTSFKLSFGAEKVCYEKPLDLPLSSNYQLMKAVEVWRRPMRKILRFGR